MQLQPYSLAHHSFLCNRMFSPTLWFLVVCVFGSQSKAYDRDKSPKLCLFHRTIQHPIDRALGIWNIVSPPIGQRGLSLTSLAIVAAVIAVYCYSNASTVVPTSYINQGRQGDHDKSKSKHLPIDSFSSSQMWASSFADLAKKASELQEQASAAVAATSMPVSQCATARIVS
jgi:hypothetical protein